MLSELCIENLAVIGAAELIFDPGLNVITGETGAGKTILAHAISLLLGTRADSALIRPGAAAASVEAVFTVPPCCFADLAGEIDVPEGEVLAVRRRISRDGRSRAFIGGRSATLSVLGELTGRLLAFSAQHEQRRLMMASRQLDIIDDYAGSGMADLLTRYQLLYDRRAELETRLADLNQDYEAREREAELLRFQVAEIEAAALAPGEDVELEAERRRLLRAQELREAAGGLAAILSGGESEGGESIMDALSQAISRLEKVAGVDAALDEITARLQTSFYELEDTGHAARDYAEAAQSDPARLAEVEERLDLIGQLRRKYVGVARGAEGFVTGDAAESAGLSDRIHEILNYAVRAGEKLNLLDGEAGHRPQMQKELAEIGEEMLMLAGRMSERRCEAAARLEVEAGRHLRELAFQDCGFKVRLKPVWGDAAREVKPNGIRDAAALEASLSGIRDAAALTRTGADIAEFFVRLNLGMPAAPLRETASGGEMSRIMLAVKSAVSASRETATLVFDEIDAGIGGETGAAVGAKLKSLAGGSQIICITHLPQIACCADTHFRVVKHSGDGRTVTTVERLKGGSVVDELCRMMGSRPEDANARAHARELLQRAKSESGKSGKSGKSGESAAHRNKSVKASTRAGSR